MNNRYGDDRWQDRNSGRGYNRERGGNEDRGFFERAGEQVRSWMGGDDDDDRQRQSGGGERRYNQDVNSTYMGQGNTTSGWGNQSGDSWNRDRPGVPYMSDDRSSSGGWGSEHGSRDVRQSQQYGNERSQNSGWSASGGDRDRQQSHSYSEPTSRGGGGGGGPEVFGEPVPGGTSGFGGGTDNGRRFDRIDAGSTGTHGAHPMSSPVGGAYGGGYGISASGASGSSARYAAQSQGGGTSGSGSMLGGASMQGRGIHDPHYSEWRNQQIQSLDRDYEEYCAEHKSKFEREFGDWRTKRGQQRQSMGKVTEHMEVMGSDGQKIGVVDKVAGDRIILTKNDENAGGHHHSIPCSWIESVDDKLTVNKTREEAMSAWRDEENNRALFERENQGSEGPHVLNRSFSGTY